MSVYTPIIKNVPYENGLFPSIPSVPMGSAVLLTDGRVPPVLVDSNLSVRQIRNGKYSRQVEISTNSHLIEVYYSAPSKDDPYQFQILMKIAVRVFDPIKFHQSGFSDVVALFSQWFSSTVRRSAKKFAIKEYRVLDETILSALQPNGREITDSNSGIAYFITDVETSLDQEALARIKQKTDHDLNVEDELSKARVAEKLSSVDIKKAILSDVGSGKLTMAEAIIKLENLRHAHGNRQREEVREMISFINEMRSGNNLTASEAAELVKNLLHTQKLFPVQPVTEDTVDDYIDGVDDDVLNSLYKDGDQ